MANKDHLDKRQRKESKKRRQQRKQGRGRQWQSALV